MYFRGTAIGRLTRDPELRKTKTDKSVCNFTIAINNPYTKSDEDTQFVKVTVWNGLAESAKKNLNKGRLVLVEGEIELSEYQSPETQEKYSDIVITANNVRYLDSPNGSSNTNNNYNNQNSYKEDKAPQNEAKPKNESEVEFDTQDYTSDEDAYDFDVPF